MFSNYHVILFSLLKLIFAFYVPGMRKLKTSIQNIITMPDQSEIL